MCARAGVLPLAHPSRRAEPRGQGGDAFFALYEMLFPWYCSPEGEPHDSSCSAAARAKLNRPGNNVFQVSMVEVDPRMGVYNGCMPNATTGQFQCHPYADVDLCWYDPNFTSPDGRVLAPGLEGVCSREVCHCPAAYINTVGSYRRPMAQWPTHWHNQTAMWEQIEAIGDKIDGVWYSTRAEGQCHGDQRVGSGECFWRWHGVTRTVNATCVADRLRGEMVHRNPRCFASLPDGGKNRSTIAWSKCLAATLSGRAAGAGAMPPPTPLTRADILAPFEGAFHAATGCPELHPGHL